MTGPDPAAPQWAPERPVPPDLVAGLIARQFPRLAGAPVEPLAAGWDNIVYRVARQWVFRFPRREIALPGVRREIIFLPRMAPHLPLPIPVPEFAGEPSAQYPWPFWGARMLPGSELAQAGLPDARRHTAAAGVGRFLRALHDPGLVISAGARELPADPMGRADAAKRAHMSREVLARLAGQGLWKPSPATERLIRDAERLGGPSAAPVLAHGDLHMRHLLVGAGGHAAGVIDWGDLCLADPAVDLSLAYGAFAGPARAALLDAYGPVSPQTQTRARILALFLCAVLAEYAASEGLGRLLREALTGLVRATEGRG
jgi:aminoglycoside phosphotransferase (APT) family kinase protein